MCICECVRAFFEHACSRANMCAFDGVWWSTTDPIRLIPLLGLWLGWVHLHGNSALCMFVLLTTEGQKKLKAGKGKGDKRKAYTQSWVGENTESMVMLSDVVKCRWWSPVELVGVQAECVCVCVCLRFISAGKPGNGECVDYTAIMFNFYSLTHAEWKLCPTRHGRTHTNTHTGSANLH